ncbi:hypothetical protein [Ornithinibacillus contaminans]|uniref:hypothetical protein n=1 Tax=Ornithinibacillus contaminans TaxID=694055 RepID=UPI00064E0446|nr:hypothetical protein [Ornithinibacillus contaminans]
MFSIKWRVKSKIARIYLSSILITLMGFLLPWIHTHDRSGSGLYPINGVIALLILVSLIVFFTVKNKMLVSIVMIITGVLSFLIVFYTFFSSLVVFINPFISSFVSYGIGIFVTALGTLGIIIAGIVGIKVRNNDNSDLI